jgi:glycosyltransferase involved in cell wall biosynthesis
MTKILSIYYRPKPGGFCKRLYMAYEAFAENGWEVHYLSLEKFPLNHKNIYFYKIPLVFKKNENFLFWINFFFVSIFYMFIINMKISPDLIVVFGQAYSSLSFPAKFIKKNRIALFTRGDQLQSLKETKKGIERAIQLIIYNIVSSIGFKVSNSVIFNSSYMFERAKNKYHLKNKKFFVLPNNIIHSQLKNRKDALEKIRNEFHTGEDSFILLSAGRLHPGKNLEFLIKIFSRVNDKLKKENAFLFIVGDDPLTGNKEKIKITSIIKEYGLNNVILTGWREDVDTFYAAADVFIIASKYEGAPNSLLEAIGYGLPSIGSDIGEIREILGNEGLLFPLDKTGIEKAADLIVKVYNDENFLISIKSLISGIRKKFTFDWKLRLYNIVGQAVE